jgi:tRNA A-37 threonylcarbamoyl transferase component Bud32
MVPQGPTTGNDPHPHSVALECGTARAIAVAAVAGGLRTLLQREVADWESLGLERIKERTVRSVFRGTLDGVHVHAKAYRADKLADRARDALRRPRGEREAQNLIAARRLGLPAAEPLAWGIAADRGQARSFVVTRTIPGALPFAFTSPPDVQRRTGALLRRMHDLGLQPADLHAGNLVIDGAEQPWLLDLAAVRQGGGPSLVRRAAGLAFFCHELDAGALDRDARDLLAAYRDAGPPLPPDLDRELALATHRWRRGALVSFGRRASRDCRHTEVQARSRGQPRWFWHRGGEDDPRLRASCVELSRSDQPPLRQGRRGAVWVGDDLVWKQRDRGAARRAWRAAYWLLFARVGSAAPVGLCLMPDRGLLFSRRAGELTLAEELASGRLGAAAIASAATSLGNSIGRLHAHGLRNRDLKLENLVRCRSSGEVLIVDLDGVRRSSADDARGRGADLGRLFAAFRAAGSPGGAGTVRIFLRGYLRANRRLLQQPPLRRILRAAKKRAAEWASAHR